MVARMGRLLPLLVHRLACSVIALPPADARWLSVALHSFLLLVSAPSLEGEVGVWPRCHQPQWNCWCSLSGQSALQP
jgi:hypothetical protein